MADLNQAKLLSASSLENGRAIDLTTTAQVVHVAVNSTTEWDVVTIFVNHTGTGTHQVTINWGGVDFVLSLSQYQMIVAVDRWRINSGLEIKLSQSASSNMAAYVMVDRYPAG